MTRTILGVSILALFALVSCTKETGSGGGAGGTGGMAMGGTGGAGGSSQLLPVGSPCAKDADCGGADFMCMTDHPDGYCIKMCDIANGDADCPAEAICQFDGTAGECHAKCDTATDCRMGYECAPAAMDPMNQASHAFCDVAP